MVNCVSRRRRQLRAQGVRVLPLAAVSSDERIFGSQGPHAGDCPTEIHEHAPAVGTPLSVPFDSHGARRVELSVKVRRHIRPDLAAPPVMKRHRVEHQSHRTYFDRSGREKDSRQKHNAGRLTGDLRSRAAGHARRRYSAPSAWVNPWITPRVEPGRPCDALLFPERRLSPVAGLLARSATRG